MRLRDLFPPDSSVFLVSLTPDQHAYLESVAKRKGILPGKLLIQMAREMLDEKLEAEEAMIVEGAEALLLAEDSEEDS